MNPLFKERRGKSDMPYIRTKNFIHDSKDVVVVNENGTLVVLRGIDKDFIERTHGRTWNTGTNVVLAQADTIKELCDELVLIEVDGYPTLLEELYFERRRFLRKNEYEFLSVLPENPIIYGAIWTDEGLIYVAKMNDKGELELL